MGLEKEFIAHGIAKKADVDASETVITDAITATEGVITDAIGDVGESDLATLLATILAERATDGLTFEPLNEDGVTVTDGYTDTEWVFGDWEEIIEAAASDLILKAIHVLSLVAYPYVVQVGVGLEGFEAAVCSLKTTPILAASSSIGNVHISSGDRVSVRIATSNGNAQANSAKISIGYVPVA